MFRVPERVCECVCGALTRRVHLIDFGEVIHVGEEDGRLLDE